MQLQGCAQPSWCKRLRRSLGSGKRRVPPRAKDFWRASNRGACRCSQVIETVLSYLVLGDGLPDEAPLIAALPDMCATLQLAFHKSDPQELASRSALVEHLLKVGKERQGKHTVNIPLLAHRLRVPFTELQEQLRQLAEAGEVSYTSSDRALCLKVCCSVQACLRG